MTRQILFLTEWFNILVTIPADDLYLTLLYSPNHLKAWENHKI